MRGGQRSQELQVECDVVELVCEACGEIVPVLLLACSPLLSLSLSPPLPPQSAH
jgi:translation initiation factor 2 beta subunit (eIF-2beta)/eIF-5